MDYFGLPLHHIGIVVDNSEKAANMYQHIFRDNACCRQEYIPSQEVLVCMVQSNGCAVEFISPTSCNSPVSNYLLSGGGLHHLCYETRDIKLASEHLKAELRPITGIFTGYQGRKCAFFWVKRTELGIGLVELIENDGRSIQ